ncbi:AbrB/MazE/SpoVT family DNA-binding domain-containing protein [Neorhizobium sp. NPDC001467]|uniref:AbrB/MazE/SpoVT family DNA-binding domain-containing protein n=1 Tax=Neorhizobium sp. NPDC001467 TaxID=3390595 RepID=UPI003D02E2D2
MANDAPSSSRKGAFLFGWFDGIGGLFYYKEDFSREAVMRVTVKKMGGSASIPIPDEIMEAANLAVDAEVEVSEQNGRVIVELPREGDQSLDEMIARITPDNAHDNIDFGVSVGRELL